MLGIAGLTTWGRAGAIARLAPAWAVAVQRANAVAIFMQLAVNVTTIAVPAPYLNGLCNVLCGVGGQWRG